MTTFDQIFFDDWEQDGKEQLVKDFQLKGEELDGFNILFAAYTYEDYSGDAVVLAEKDGKLFAVHGGHCSCYGLEDQWECEEIEPKALVHQMENGSFYKDSVKFRHKDRITSIAKGFISVEYNPSQQADTDDDV